MATTDDPKAGQDEQSAPAADNRINLRLQLQPVDHSDQPLFSNFTSVQGAPGLVFVDFGFLEPATLPGVARLAKSGGKVPQTINGRLACRVVLGLDAAAQLTQQLELHMKSLSAPKAPRGKPN